MRYQAKKKFILVTGAFLSIILIVCAISLYSIADAKQLSKQAIESNEKRIKSLEDDLKAANEKIKKLNKELKTKKEEIKGLKKKPVEQPESKTTESGTKNTTEEPKKISTVTTKQNNDNKQAIQEYLNWVEKNSGGIDIYYSTVKDLFDNPQFDDPTWVDQLRNEVNMAKLDLAQHGHYLNPPAKYKNAQESFENAAKNVELALEQVNKTIKDPGNYEQYHQEFNKYIQKADIHYGEAYHGWEEL